jgi:hypothetical protein
MQSVPGTVASSLQRGFGGFASVVLSFVDWGLVQLSPLRRPRGRRVQVRRKTRRVHATPCLELGSRVRNTGRKPT